MIATKTDLKTFRKEAAIWIKENYPASLYGAPKSYEDIYWGGRNQENVDGDLLLWFNRCYEKGWA